MSEQLLNSIKEARAKSGYTQKEVEKLLGMRNLMMRDYEVGRLKLPISVAVALAGLYKVSIDELVGHKRPDTDDGEKVLLNFRSLFHGNGFEVMFLDPVLRGFLENYQGQFFEKSLFELLTLEFSEKEKKELILNTAKFMNSVAGADGKVSQSETRCVRFLLESFGIENKYRLVSNSISQPYLPEVLSPSLLRPEIKHFIIWILFFFAHSDGEITYQEVEYIEKCAEALKVNRSNFLFIKEKFYSQEVV